MSFTFDEALYDAVSTSLQNIVDTSDGTGVATLVLALVILLTQDDRSSGVHVDDLQHEVLAHADDDEDDEDEQDDASELATGGDVATDGRHDFSLLFFFNQFTCELCCLSINAAAAINSLAFMFDSRDAVSRRATDEL